MVDRRRAKLRALIYSRVSKDRQHGRSPAEQESDSRGVCEREGWVVAHVVSEARGASRYSKGFRSGWAEVERLLEAGEVDVLVTWESSRANRSMEGYLDLRNLCERFNVLWSYSGDTYDLSKPGDRYRTGMDALNAEREVDDIRARILRTVRLQAAAGKPHGRRVFGYQRVYDPATGILVNQEPDPDEAAVVRRIFADYLAGQGMGTIARALSDEGVRTNTGLRRWRASHVRYVLTNPTYAARRVHRGEVVGEATWPAIIDADTFDRVQARRASLSEGHSRQRYEAHLLTGVGRCGECRTDGTPSRVRVVTGHGGRKMYACRANHCVARSLDKLDAYVSALLLARLEGPDADTDGFTDPAVAAAQAEVAELAARLDDAVAQFTEGRIDGSTLAKIEGNLRPRIRAAEAAARAALVPLDLDVPDGDLEHWWDVTLTGEQRRAVVAWHIAAVVIRRTRQGERTFDPTAVTVEWRRGSSPPRTRRAPGPRSPATRPQGAPAGPRGRGRPPRPGSSP